MSERASFCDYVIYSAREYRLNQIVTSLSLHPPSLCVCWPVLPLLGLTWAVAETLRMSSYSSSFTQLNFRFKGKAVNMWSCRSIRPFILTFRALQTLVTMIWLNEMIRGLNCFLSSWWCAVVFIAWIGACVQITWRTISLTFEKKRKKDPVSSILLSLTPWAHKELCDLFSLFLCPIKKDILDQFPVTMVIGSALPSYFCTVC